PAHVRLKDAEAGGVLRALFSVFARSSVEIDAEIDRFHDSLFVETAPEEALDALAALAAAPALKRAPPGAGVGQRAFIANAVRRRRGKGTALAFETLAGDLTGRAAVAVEYFQRLVRTPHLIDPRPDRHGVAAPRAGTTAAEAGGPFDMAPRLLDMRGPRRVGPGFPVGRHAIRTVAVHVARPVALPFPAPPGARVGVEALAGVPPMRPWAPGGGSAPPGFFQLAAQPGETVALFNPDRRPEARDGRLGPVHRADRLRRLPLHLETEALRRAAAEGLPPPSTGPGWFDAAGNPFAIYLRRAGETAFRRAPPEEIVIADLNAAPAGRPAGRRTLRWFEAGSNDAVARSAESPIACAFDPVTARLIAAAPAAGEQDVVEVRLAHAVGRGAAMGAGPQDRNAEDQPFELRLGATPSLIRIVDPAAAAGPVASAAQRSVPTLAAALADVAAHGAGKRAVLVLTHCGVEGTAAPLDMIVHPGSELFVIAGQWRAAQAVPGTPVDPGLAGFIVRRERRFTLNAPVRALRAGGSDPARAGRLTIDGLELTQGLTLEADAVSAATLRHVTLRQPGGVALSAPAALTAAAIALDACVCGPVRFGSQATARLSIRATVLGADGASGLTLDAPAVHGELRDVTIIGGARLRSVEATGVIFDEPVVVERRQAGCVRFSWVAPGSSVPRRWRCQPALALAAAAQTKGAALTDAEAELVASAAAPVLLDRALSSPTLAMLHPLSPRGVALGGEGELEMGAFAGEAFGLLAANLEDMFLDALPFGMEGGVIDDTRSDAISAQRARP
ncbi:MAG: hypothetical protein ACK4WC_03915, partial [Rubrimonas sp.]